METSSLLRCKEPSAHDTEVTLLLGYCRRRQRYELHDRLTASYILLGCLLGFLHCSHSCCLLDGLPIFAKACKLMVRLLRIAVPSRILCSDVSHCLQVACLQSELPGLVETRFMSYMQNIAETSSDAAALPEITFLYKLVPGLADRSFGLHVARMASLPESAVQKAAVKADEMETAVAAKHG